MHAYQKRQTYLRQEVIALGFTSEQFLAMANRAYAWPDVHNWLDACLAVRNTCLAYGSLNALRNSNCDLAKAL